MKIDERIILYLDKQMSHEEIMVFEIELNKSPELSRQVESYKGILHSLKMEEQNLVDEDYFVNLVPKFRNKLSEDKKTFKFKTAYALTFTAIVLATILFFFNPFRTSEYDSADKIISTLNENETAEILNYYTDNTSSISGNNLSESSDSLFSELISSELNFQESDLKSLTRSDNNYLESLYAELQPEEVDLIYDEILKTKFF